jgi:hypothetical protein
MDLGAIIYLLIFRNIGLGVQNLMEGNTDNIVIALKSGATASE